MSEEQWTSLSQVEYCDDIATPQTQMIKSNLEQQDKNDELQLSSFMSESYLAMFPTKNNFHLG